jgi:hypothetical protein
MSKTASVGYFTHGVSPDSYDLPHPRLAFPVILLVRRVLCRAFDELRNRKSSWLANAKEDDVTAALLSIIESNYRQRGTIPGFDRRSYELVVRQAQVSNFDGTRLTKTPDLRFTLRNDEAGPRRTLSEYEGIFVECKPVDASHSVGSKYCDDGLNRFIEGHYAWAMQQGIMLAYARHGRTITKDLIPAMKEKIRMKTLATISLPTPASKHETLARAGSVHISNHRRGFTWRDGKGPATDITIYHLWHDCN